MNKGMNFSASVNHFGPNPTPRRPPAPRNTPPAKEQTAIQPQTASELLVAMNAAIAANNQQQYATLAAYGIQQGWIKQSGGLPADVLPGEYNCVADTPLEIKESAKGTLYATVELTSDDGSLNGFRNFCVPGTFILAGDSVILTVVETEVGQYSPYGTTTLATTQGDVNA